MKGIVLAGGIGSRLYPLTRVTNKHLLPVYDKPMIFYPLQILVDAGIRDILIVTGGHNAGDFLRLLQNGKEFGLQQLSFAYQEGEAGIADALRLAEPWAKGDKICVVLGDNIIEGDIREAATNFEQLEKGAMVMLKDVTDPERFGVPVFENGRIVRIEEKPKKPLSSLRGDRRLFLRWHGLRPHSRAEAVGSRRVRDHRRQQQLHRRRHAAPHPAGRLVDRRRHVRIALARQQHGARQSAAQRSQEPAEVRGVMKLLVTGGAGFIGSNFVHRMLARHPDWKLVVLDKLTYAGNLKNLEPALQQGRCEFVQMDICDRDVLEPRARLRCRHPLRRRKPRRSQHRRRRGVCAHQRRWAPTTCCRPAAKRACRALCTSAPTRCMAAWATDGQFIGRHAATAEQSVCGDESGFRPAGSRLCPHPQVSRA